MRAPPRDRLSTLGLTALGLTALGLTAATFFIVSGGPYGVEEIVLGHGYAGAVGLLLVVPLVWSLPVALMVGELGAALLAPFAAVLALAVAMLARGGLAAAQEVLRQPAPTDAAALAAGLILAMWNLKGFDNASTFAGEVRDPGRSYPRAMAISAASIAAMHVATVLAASVTGMPPAAWTSGAWVEVGARLGGGALAAAVSVGGAILALGLYLAQLLSWSRLPVALAEDRWLPRGLGRRSARTHAPVRAVAVAALPTALLAIAAWQGRDEPGALGMSAVGLSAIVAAVGPAWWAADRVLRRRGAAALTHRS